MKLFRRISMPVHGLVELAAGLSLVSASLVLGSGLAGILAVFTAGVVLAGVGLGAAENLPLAAHQALDRWLVTALSLVSIALALGGEPAAGLTLLLVAAGLLVLNSATRWTRPAFR